MKITENKRTNNEVLLKLEEDYELIIKKTDDIFQIESNKYRIPGFRKGKATREVFDQHFGKGFLLEKALNEAIYDCYEKAVVEAKLFPVDYPKDIDVLKLEENEPVVFTLTVTVKPEIKLSKYKGLRADSKKISISNTEVDAKLIEISNSFAEYADSLQPSKLDDIVRYDIKAISNDVAIDKYTQLNQATRIGLNQISAEFDQELIGLKVGESKNFQLSFPDDFKIAELKGKTVDFSVLLIEAKEKKLPALDDEFAKKISDKETITALKTDMLEMMTKHAQSQEETATREQLVEELIRENPIDIPQAMIDRQIDNFISRLKSSVSQQNLHWDDYLKLAKKSVDELRNEYQEPAKKRVAADLILAEIIEKEALTLSDAEVDAELTRIASEEFKKPLEEVRKQLEASLPYIKEYLLINKSLDLVVENAKIKIVK